MLRHHCSIHRTTALFSRLLAPGLLALFALSQPVNAALEGWIELPDTSINPVCPDIIPNDPNYLDTNGDPYYFKFYCTSVTRAWNGGAFDTLRNRLYVWGGGHGDYMGNEIYALDINNFDVNEFNSFNASMIRLTDPAPLATSVPQGEPNYPEELFPFDGTQPNSRHTYDGMVYMPNIDKIWVWGGSLALDGDASNATWLFDPSNDTWQRQSPAYPVNDDHPQGEELYADLNAVSAYDPNTGLVFIHNHQDLYSYEYNSSGGIYKRLSNNASGFTFHINAVIDSDRKKFIILGGGQQFMYDISPGSDYELENIAAVGDANINDLIFAQAPGLAYDPVIQKTVAWAGGDTLHILDLDATPPTWTTESYPIQPPFATEPPVDFNDNGTYGRFAYAPPINGFITYNRVREGGDIDPANFKNGHIFRWPDFDDDGIIDKLDNCIEVANADQRDTDNDGYGNMCDADLNNTGTTNTLDLNLYRAAHRSTLGDTEYNEDADFNGDGNINTLDLNIYRSLHRKQPGPSCCGS